MLWIFCQIKKHTSYLPRICAKVKNSGIVIFIIYLTHLTILPSFNLTRQEHKNFQLKLFNIAVTLKYGQDH